MQSGLVYGHVGMVDFVVRKMKEELRECTRSGKEPLVIATGGLATLIDQESSCIDYVHKMLTLQRLEKTYTQKKRENATRRKRLKK